MGLPRRLSVFGRNEFTHPLRLSARLTKNPAAGCRGHYCCSRQPAVINPM